MLTNKFFEVWQNIKHENSDEVKVILVLVMKGIHSILQKIKNILFKKNTPKKSNTYKKCIVKNIWSLLEIFRLLFFCKMPWIPL